MWTMSPLMTGPFFVMWVLTITSMFALTGTVRGGGGLLPGRVVQVWPHHGERLLFSKPLKAAGASPVLSRSFFHHWAPHQYTWPPETSFRSLITKAPPPGA